MEECKFPDNIVFKPDGEHELVPCEFREAEVYHNVTIQILRCLKCGKESIGWYRQNNTIKGEIVHGTETNPNI